MEHFATYIAGIEGTQRRQRVEAVLAWVRETFPELAPRIAWNQPVFTDHGTYIIGFSVAKPHLAVAPERAGILRFSEEIQKAGYGHSQQLVRIRWEQPVPYSLLEKMIRFNREDKAGCATFWRK